MLFSVAAGPTLDPPSLQKFSADQVKLSIPSVDSAILYEHVGTTASDTVKEVASAVASTIEVVRILLKGARFRTQVKSKTDLTHFLLVLFRSTNGS